MKNNFTESQFAEVKNVFGTVFNVTLNKGGNIKVMLPNAREFWVLYFTPNGRYMWRRHNLDTMYCCPLNMKNRKITNLLIHETGVYEYYCVARHAEFWTVDEAIEYFKKYLKKYRSIIID